MKIYREVASIGLLGILKAHGWEALRYGYEGICLEFQLLSDAPM